jgi:hypothetical protein
VNQALQGASEALEPKCLTGRPEHFTDRAGFGPGQKKPSFSGRENPSHARPMGRVGPQFSGRAWAGSGLGQAAYAFYTVE